MALDNSLIADGRFRGEADMHGRVPSPAASAPDPQAVIAGVEIPQRSSLLRCWGVLPFGRSTGATGSETARLHCAHRRRGSRNAGGGFR